MAALVLPTCDNSMPMDNNYWALRLSVCSRVNEWYLLRCYRYNQLNHMRIREQHSISSWRHMGKLWRWKQLEVVEDKRKIRMDIGKILERLYGDPGPNYFSFSPRPTRRVLLFTRAQMIAHTKRYMTLFQFEKIRNRHRRCQPWE